MIDGTGVSCARVGAIVLSMLVEAESDQAAGEADYGRDQCVTDAQEEALGVIGLARRGDTPHADPFVKRSLTITGVSDPVLRSIHDVKNTS